MRAVSAPVAVVWFLLSTNAFSQENRPAEEVTPPSTIVVTAAEPQDQSGTTPGVIVIDLDDVVDPTTATLADLVTGVPGLDLQRQGSRFESSTVRIRGSESEQVLLLRDGRLLSDSRSAVVDLSRISLSGVDRIEIVYGPATALYGYGGAAGAINLITDSPSPGDDRTVSGSGRVLLGSFSEVRVGATTTIPISTETVRREVEIALDGASAKNSYQFQRNGETDRRDNAGGYDAHGRLAYRRRGDEVDYGLDASVSSYDRGLPGTVEFPASSAELTEQRSAARADVSWRDLLAVELGHSRSDRRFRDDRYPLGPLDAASTLYATDGTAALNLPGTIPVGAFRFTLPVSGKRELLQDTELGNRQRIGGAVAPRISVSISVPGGSLVGTEVGGRLERITGTDEKTRTLSSGRGSIDWTAAMTPVWFGIALSAGYRLPDFAELFTQGSAYALGNPELKPEKSRGIEWEVRLGDRYVQPANAEVAPLISRGARATVFYTEYERLIQWLPDPRGVWKPRNTGAAQIYGFEGEGTIAFPIGLSPWDVQSTLGFDLLEGRDRTDGITRNNRLPYRSRVSFQGELGVEHLFGHRIWGEVTGRGARPATRQNTVWLDPYIDIAIGGRFAVVPETAFFGVTVDNLFDQRFVQSRFYPNPGREIRLSLEVQW